MWKGYFLQVYMPKETSRQPSFAIDNNVYKERMFTQAKRSSESYIKYQFMLWKKVSRESPLRTMQVPICMLNMIERKKTELVFPR